MLCTLFSRVGVLPRNLTTLPFFLGCFLLRLFFELQWCLVRLGVWSLHCERRTVCCPLLLGFSWLFPWRLLGVHLGGAGHGHLCHISLERWHMVSVVVSGVIHACTFEGFFKYNLAWICLAIFPHSSILMLCHNIAHLPNLLILM